MGQQPRWPEGRFPASLRLRKRSEFQRVQGGARRIVTPHFVLLMACASDAGVSRPARLGITASRKIGCAAVRNRAKRLVREAFRATRSLWPNNLELVVIVRHLDSTIKMQSVISEWMAAESRIEGLARAVLASCSQAEESAGGSGSARE